MIVAAAAVPVYSLGRREEPTQESDQDQQRPASGALLVIAGAAVALGHGMAERQFAVAQQAQT